MPPAECSHLLPEYLCHAVPCPHQHLCHQCRHQHQHQRQHPQPQHVVAPELRLLRSPPQPFESHPPAPPPSLSSVPGGDPPRWLLLRSTCVPHLPRPVPDATKPRQNWYDRARLAALGGGSAARRPIQRISPRFPAAPRTRFSQPSQTHPARHRANPGSMSGVHPAGCGDQHPHAGLGAQ